MASLLFLNCSLPLQSSSSSSSQPQPRKFIDTLSSSNPIPCCNNSSYGCLKPIIVNGDPPTFVSAPGRRIVAVGDLHGDLDKARSALEIAGVLSSDGQNLWIGGETVLVQLGDILDRGEDEIAILSLLRSLDIQAKATGGAVFQVNGNHETMNVEGDFRYVDSGAFDECTNFLEYLEECEFNWEEAFVSWINSSERWKEDRKMSQSYWGPWNLVKVCSFLETEPFSLDVYKEKVKLAKALGITTQGQRQKGVIARSVLLRPGGPLASELARHPVVLKIDDWVFCHGGLLPHHVSYGIEKMNREVSHWMRGLSDTDGHSGFPFIATRGYDSVVWNRLYSRDISDLYEYQIDQIESLLEETLQAVGGKAMVVGHTPQPMGANCKFKCSIWRIDVGMSSGVLDSRPEFLDSAKSNMLKLVNQVLEIRGNEARVVRSKRDGFSELQVVDYT